MPEKQKVKSEKLSKISFILLAILIGMGVFNILILGDASLSINSLTKAAEEEARPANLELMKIVDSACSDCFDIDKIIDGIKSSNVKITSESTLEFTSKEAQDLIDKYDIEKIPTFVITGETNKTNVKSLWNQIGEVKEDGTVIFTRLNPVYVDVKTKEILGRVTITLIKDSSCSVCTDLSSLIQQLKQAGVQVTKETTLEYTSDDAKELIQKYDLKKIPALIISDNILEYQTIKQAWDQLNATKKDGFYALHAMVPPYMDLGTNKIVGLVSVIYLSDKSCSECYNVTLHKSILQRFGVAIADEKTYDISSDDGKKLVDGYKIVNVPAILLSPEVNVYPALLQVWPSVGTVENDGWYVFRSTQQMGAYKDLSTGMVVKPQTAP